MTRRAICIIPTLDEEARIGDLLAQLARLPAAMVPEILVADGGSRDETRAIVARMAALDARIRLVDNPQRIQSAGINRAVAAARSDADTIVRIDAHARYPDDYVPRILQAFATSGAAMVATRLDTVGETCTQRGIAAAANSRGGSGDSAHRIGGFSGFVDHGHHAGMDRAMFVAIGGYDDTFVANEDAELDYRVRRAGERIWLAGDIAATYFPRTSLSALARQYWRYGIGRASTWRKHRERLRLRQILPVAIVAALAFSVATAPFAPWLLAMPLMYVALLAGLTAQLYARRPQRCTLLAGPAMATMHLAWGAGFIARIIGGGRSLPFRPSGWATDGIQRQGQVGE